MDPVFALAIADQVDRYGTYVGIAAFFGLAVLTVLYFAQARELKRLREWAGRAPEAAAERPAKPASAPARPAGVPVRPVRAQPLGADSATAVAESAVGQPTVAAPALGMGAVGATTIHPAAAALPAATAAGAVASVDVPDSLNDAEGVDDDATEAHALAPVEAGPATAEAAALAEAALDAPTDAPPPNGQTTGVPASWPPSSRVAAGRPGGARPPTPLRAPGARRPVGSAGYGAAAARRRDAPEPPAETAKRSGIGRKVAYAIAGLAVIAGAAFGAVTLLGGGNDPAPKPNAVVAGGEPKPRPSRQTSSRSSLAAGRKGATVAVFNGTGSPGLAQSLQERLVSAGYPEQGNTGNAPDQTLQSSAVYYAAGERRQATDVARLLKIESIEAIDADKQSLAGQNAKLLVVVGADKAPTQ